MPDPLSMSYCDPTMATCLPQDNVCEALPEVTVEEASYSTALPMSLPQTIAQYHGMNPLLANSSASISVPAGIELDTPYSIAENFHLIPEPMRPHVQMLRGLSTVTFSVQQLVTPEGVTQYQFFFRNADAGATPAPRPTPGSTGGSGMGSSPIPEPSMPHWAVPVYYAANVGYLLAVDAGVAELVEADIIPAGMQAPATLTAFYFTHRGLERLGVAGRWNWSQVARSMPLFYSFQVLSSAVLREAGVNTETLGGRALVMGTSMLPFYLARHSATLNSALRVGMGLETAAGLSWGARSLGFGFRVLGAVGRVGLVNWGLGAVNDITDWVTGRDEDGEQMLGDFVWQRVVQQERGDVLTALLGNVHEVGMRLDNYFFDDHSEAFDDLYFDTLHQSHQAARSILEIVDHSFDANVQIDLPQLRRSLQSRMGSDWTTQHSAQFTELQRFMDQRPANTPLPLTELVMSIASFGFDDNTATDILVGSLSADWDGFENTLEGIYAENSSDVQAAYQLMNLVQSAGADMPFCEDDLLDLVDESGSLRSRTIMPELMQFETIPAQENARQSLVEYYQRQHNDADRGLRIHSHHLNLSSGEGADTQFNAPTNSRQIEFFNGEGAEMTYTYYRTLVLQRLLAR